MNIIMLQLQSMIVRLKPNPIRL